MPRDTVALTMDGKVTASLFTEVVRHYTGLLLALSNEIARNQEIEWRLDGLIGVETDATEAGIAYRGEAKEPEAVERVVEAYGVVGQSLERKGDIPYSGKVDREARALTKVLNGHITALRFQTPEIDATVYSESVLHPPAAPTLRAYGAVTGRIQTLSNRQGLRFTLYDTLHDKAVMCYLREGQEEVMRGMWGKLAIVEGWVSRDALTGRPISVREVANVTPRLEVEPGNFRLARGAVDSPAGAALPEIIVRRLRDA